MRPSVEVGLNKAQNNPTGFVLNIEDRLAMAVEDFNACDPDAPEAVGLLNEVKDLRSRWRESR